MATVEELMVVFKGDNSDLMRAIGQSERALDSMTRPLAGIGRAAAVGLAAGTTALVGIGAASVKAAATFEQSFAEVRKTTEATEEEFLALEARIREMATSGPATAASIAEVVGISSQLGIAKENVLDFTQTMLELSVASNLTAEEGAVAFARFANITGLAQDQFDELGSSVVALGNNLATTEAEIVSMATRIAAAGTQVGLTQAEILAFAGTLSSVGVQAEAGGTAFSRVLSDLATAVASGGDKLEGFAEVAGQSAEDFAQSFKATPAAAVQAFIEGLQRVQDSGENVFAVLEDLELGDIRVRDSLLRTAGAGDLLARSLDLASSAYAENTALTEEASLFYGTFQNNVARLRNQFTELGITVGQAVIPALLSAMEQVGPQIEALTPVLTRFAEDFAARLPELIPVVFGIVEAFAEALPQILSSIGSLMDGFVSLLGDGEDGVNIFAEALDAVGVVLEVIVPLFTALLDTLDFILPSADGVGQSFGVFLTALILIAAPMRALIGLMQAYRAVQIAVNVAMTANPIGVIIMAIAALVGIVIVVVEAFYGWDRVLADLVRGIGVSIDAMKAIASVMITAVGGAVAFVRDAFADFKGVVAGVGAAMEVVWGAARDFIVAAVIRIGEAILDLLQAMMDFRTDAIDAIRDFAERVRDFFVDLASDAYTYGRDFVLGVVAGITAFIGSAIAAARSLASSIADEVTGFLGIQSPSRLMQGVGAFLVAGLVVGIESEQDRATRAMETLARGLEEAFQPSLDAPLVALASQPTRSPLARLAGPTQAASAARGGQSVSIGQIPITVNLPQGSTAQQADQLVQELRYRLLEDRFLA